MHEIFYHLAREFGEQNINSLLIGGHAMQYIDKQRMTLDTDWLICEDDAEAAKKILKMNGYRQTVMGAGFVRYNHPISHLIDFDLMLVDRRTFDLLWSRARTYPDDKTTWHVPHPEDMIAMKLHAIHNNPKREADDLADIVRIAEFAEAELSLARIEKLCCVYANERIFGLLKELLQWKN